MLNKRLSGFIQDERGSYTMWSVAWFMIYVGIGGLAVDATDVYRHETLLQATGDASSMAGVMSLPNQTEAVDQALAYAQDNMQRTSHGTVLAETDVKLGTWNFDERTFAPDTADPNAVYVTTRREESNKNPLRMNMLRFLSLASGGDLWWNVNAEAVAVRYIPECARGGFIALNEVWWNNGIEFLNNICVHAQMKEVGHPGAKNNYYQPGVAVSRGATADLMFSDSTLATDADLSAAVDAGGVTELWPAEASLALDYMAMLEAMTDVSHDEFTAEANADLYEKYQSWEFLYSDEGTLTLVEEVPEDGVYKPHHVYVINDCDEGQLKLDQDTVLENVAIITDCKIHASADISAGNTILASTNTGDHAIKMAANAKLGSEGFCDGDNHGVQLFTPGGVDLAATAVWHGVRVAAGGDVDLAAQSNGLGLSVQSGGTIDFQSGGSKGSEFALCPNGPPEQGPFEWRYRLMH